jgi:hypothetical protein
VQKGKHVTIQRSVRIGSALAFDLRMGCDELVVEIYFGGRNPVLFG